MVSVLFLCLSNICRSRLKACPVMSRGGITLPKCELCLARYLKPSDYFPKV